jgi:cytosine/creatinine deaminase
MTADLLIRNARPWGREATDVLIRQGRIASVGRLNGAPNVEILDAGGEVLLPGLVEAHTHLDKTLWGMGWHPNSAGPRLIDKIENERRLKKELGIDAARQSARQVVQSLRMGSTHIRSHVDVDTEVGLSGIEGVMATRERYRDAIDIEIVAFPQSGMLIRPGTVALMEEALKLGAEVVGGLDPSAIDRDPKGHLDTVFEFAQKYGRPIDVHLHEPGELGGFSIELIVERTRALGMQGKVTVSHAFCLGMADRDYAKALIDDLARECIAVMTTGAPSRPVPPIKQCVDAGVVVCSGSDGIRDTWGPYGNADMLERAMLLGLRNNFRRDDEVEIALDVCTYGGAKAMAVEGYGLEEGSAADLLLVPGETPTEAVVSRPSKRTVIKRGRVVVRDGEPLVSAP